MENFTPNLPLCTKEELYTKAVVVYVPVHNESISRHWIWHSLVPRPILEWSGNQTRFGIKSPIAT